MHGIWISFLFITKICTTVGTTNEITLGNSSVTALRIPGLQSGASDGDVLTFSSGTGLITLQSGGGGGASSLNGLSDCLVDTDSVYVAEVPAGLSGNPQRNTVFGIDAGGGLTTGENNTFESYDTSNKDHVLGEARIMINGYPRVEWKDFKYYYYLQNYENYRNRLEHYVYLYSFI